MRIQNCTFVYSFVSLSTCLFDDLSNYLFVLLPECPFRLLNLGNKLQKPMYYVMSNPR